MKVMKKHLIKLLVVVLCLFSFAEFGAAADLYPWVRYIGGFQTTAGIGTGELTLNAFINEADYENGDIWTANVAGVETVIGAQVILSGSTRTGDYSFNGDILNPDDVVLSIVSSDNLYTYFTASFIDLTFECNTAIPMTCWLNEGLDANIPGTLNLTNIYLNDNAGGTGAYPSRYIDELALYLAGTNINGLKMSLLIPPVPGFDFTANSSGPITYGLIDGLQSIVVNTPPTAVAGVDGGANVSCAASSCTVALNGSGSTDTDDGIDTYDWYDVGGYIGSGINFAWTLPLGIHDITLTVTDFSGASDSDTIIIVVDPAELSFIEIDKAHVKKDGKVKIRGRLSLPAGVSHLDIDSVGRAIIGISDLAGNPVIDESVDFIESADGNKWKYNVSPTLGIKKFRIDWTGSKYNYQDGGLTITTDHIGDNETELVIISCLPYSITVGGVTITRDENGVVTASDPATKVDGDDDGDSDDSDSDGGYCPEDDDCIAGVRLPFALTPDMSIDINGTLSSIGDGYTAAVGKFKIHGRFDVTGIVDFSLLVPILDLTVTLGAEEFYGRLIISDDPVPTWTKIKPKYWKYRAH